MRLRALQQPPVRIQEAIVVVELKTVVCTDHQALRSAHVVDRQPRQMVWRQPCIGFPQRRELYFTPELVPCYPCSCLDALLPPLRRLAELGDGGREFARPADLPDGLLSSSEINLRETGCPQLHRWFELLQSTLEHFGVWPGQKHHSEDLRHFLFRHASSSSYIAWRVWMSCTAPAAAFCGRVYPCRSAPHCWR